MRFFFRLLIISSLCLITTSASAAGFELTPAAKRNPISDFELKDIDGKNVRLSEYRGQAVVVSFWATWCEPCKQELNFLSKYHKELRDKGFEVIAVATDAPETQAEVKSVARQKGWEFKVVLDTAGEVSALLNPRGATPYSMFLDRNGGLSYDHEGYTVGDEVHYKPLIESLLAESTSSESVASGGSLSFTNTFSLEARGDNGDAVVDDDYYLGINRLNIAGNSGSFSTWARIDAWKFWSRPQVVNTAGDNPYYRHLSLERLNFRYKGESTELTVGDYFLQLGRGIALAFRKGDEVSAETALRGGKVSYSVEAFKAGAFGGQVSNSNMDPISYKNLPELEDVFGGAFAEFSGIEGISLGAYGYHRLYDQPLLPGGKDWAQTAGAYIDLPGLTDWMTLYTEVDLQRRNQADAFQNGLAVMAAGTLAMGATSLLVEGVYLDDFKVDANFPSPLNRVPTLSRIRDEVISMTDYYGARTRLEHSFKDLGLLIHGNARYRENMPNTASPVIEYHGFGGFEYSFDGGKSKLNIDGGYRVDQQDKSNGLEPIRNLSHYYLSYIQSLGESYSLSISSDSEYKGYEVLGEEELEQYWYGSTFLGLNKSGLGALTFEFGYDTKNENTPSLFYAGLLKWNTSQYSEIRATVGSQRGGLKCVNGVCRIYPAFSGAKAEIIARF